MKIEIQKILGDAKGKMNGYVALLSFRYSNLCVKADAASLLPVTVVIDGAEMNIENVAQVSIPKEDVLAVIPLDPDFLFDIGKGIKKAHPEFRMDLAQNENSDDEDDKYLLFTMPKVNKDRHDILIKGVDGLHDQCKARLDFAVEQCTAKIVKNLNGVDQQIIDTVKEKLKELYDFHKDMMENLTADKKQEIEEAYQRYQEEQQQKNAEKQEAKDAQGKDKVFSMRMTEEFNG